MLIDNYQKQLDSLWKQLADAQTTKEKQGLVDRIEIFETIFQRYRETLTPY